MYPAATPQHPPVARIIEDTRRYEQGRAPSEIPDYNLAVHEQRLHQLSPLQNDHTACGKSQQIDPECAHCHEQAKQDPIVCPGCGPASPVRYCSRECALVDAYGHARVCGTAAPRIPGPTSHISVDPNLREHALPPAPLTPSTDGGPSRALKRQRTFVTLLTTDLETPLIWAWRKANGVPCAHNPNDAIVQASDYVIFRNHATPRRNLPYRNHHRTENPNADVLFTVAFVRRRRPGGGWDLAFRRARDAAFDTQDHRLVRFVYRWLLSLVRDHAATLEVRAACQTAVLEQMLLEFPSVAAAAGGSHTANATAASMGRAFVGEEDFDLAGEWAEVEPLVFNAEAWEPLLHLRHLANLTDTQRRIAWSRGGPGWTGEDPWEREGEASR